jgi:hypothetical protein
MTPYVDEVEVGISRRDDFAGTELSRSPETSMAAMAAQQKALTEARFVVAARFRRDWMEIRTRINRLCDNSGFAAEALYVKPMSKTPDQWKDFTKREQLLHGDEVGWPTGFSIRFVEAAIFEAGNIDIPISVVWEDAEVRRTLVGVMDLQSNVAYWRTITIKKVVERRYVKQGQETLGQRVNANGQLVHLVPATDAEVDQAEAAAVSKAIRTLGEKLLPPQYKIEWKERVWKTIENAVMNDPEAELKKIIDAFADKRVDPNQLGEFLGHPVAQSTPAETLKLRGIYMAISAGVASWADVMAGPPKEGDKPSAVQKTIADKIEEAKKKAVEESKKRAASRTASGQPQGQENTSKEETKEEKSAVESGKAAEAPPVKPSASQSAPQGSSEAQHPVESKSAPAVQESLHGSGPVEIPTYTVDNLPVDDLRVGDECYYRGKHLRVVGEAGEPPAWKSIGLAPEAKAEESKGRPRRRPDALDFK